MTREEAKEQLIMMCYEWRSLEEMNALEVALNALEDSRPQGYWVFEKGDGKTSADGYVCSACNVSFHTHVPYFAEYKFCPNCGAKMESEGEE